MFLIPINPCLRCVAAALRGEGGGSCKGPGVGRACRRCRGQHKGLGDCLRAPRGLRIKVRSLVAEMTAGGPIGAGTELKRRSSLILADSHAALRHSGRKPVRGPTSANQVVGKLVEVIEDLRAEVAYIRAALVFRGILMPSPAPSISEGGSAPGKGKEGEEDIKIGGGGEEGEGKEVEEMEEEVVVETREEKRARRKAAKEARRVARAA